MTKVSVDIMWYLLNLWIIHSGYVIINQMKPDIYIK